MKRFGIFMVLFLFMGGVFYLYAQDFIILKDGNIIEAKVMEISPTEIRYKRFDHLDGPTIVVMAVDVLSIKYENGRTEIVNTVPQEIRQAQPAATPPSSSVSPTTVQTEDDPDRNSRLNTIGVALGYQGISAFGFSINGTVSPGKYTFFDFNLGLGFNSFAFNGRINFNVFVPFNSGGWYAGGGIGGGYNDVFGGVFAGNLTTGFIFFDWLNVAYTLQFGEFGVNNNIVVGYSYRFKLQQNSEAEQSITNISVNYYTVVHYYTVESVAGNVLMFSKDEKDWVKIKVGDILSDDTRVDMSSKSSLVLKDENNTISLTGFNNGLIKKLILKYYK